MNYRGAILHDMQALLRLFRPHCADTQTLDALAAIAADDERCIEAHALFQAIRAKTLKAKQPAHLAQYQFEEMCAKALYNLCLPGNPFDPDSPYFVVPNAIALARRIGIADSAVLDCVQNTRA